ncbi:MAG: hypothetical protein UZ14_CFX002002209 [Chloroflexi bacterium OLB14]|nr:MAG: hypothetical protein UZ14_CFX002002209 [Chloroflexi bacterium OLB14]
MKKQTRLFYFLSIFILFLFACNLPSQQGNQAEDTNATAAAQTIEAVLTASNATPIFTTTAPVPATLTLIPSPVFTNTPPATATPKCPLAQFVTDVTVPDGAVMAPNQTFNKKWRLKNIGDCTWNGYTLVFDSGDSMNGPASKPIGVVNPGQEIDIDVDLKAPASAGDYRGYWRLVTNANVLVPIVSGYQGRSFYVDIKVVAPTNTSAPIFAVTSVSFANVGGCNGFTTTANITVNGPGTVKVKWVRSDGATPPVPPDIVFAAAGTQSVSISWTTTASGTHWFDLYVDSPNNQTFGRAQFTCP